MAVPPSGKFHGVGPPPDRPGGAVRGRARAPSVDDLGRDLKIGKIFEFRDGIPHLSAGLSQWLALLASNDQRKLAGAGFYRAG